MTRDTRRLAGAAEVAGWFDPPVAPRTIAVWRQRGEEYGIPCPAPVVEITTARSDILISGWDISQKQAWIAWKETMPGMGWAKKDKVEADE